MSQKPLHQYFIHIIAINPVLLVSDTGSGEANLLEEVDGPPVGGEGRKGQLFQALCSGPLNSTFHQGRADADLAEGLEKPEADLSHVSGFGAEEIGEDPTPTDHLPVHLRDEEQVIGTFEGGMEHFFPLRGGDVALGQQVNPLGADGVDGGDDLGGVIGCGRADEERAVVLG